MVIKKTTKKWTTLKWRLQHIFWVITKYFNYVWIYFFKCLKSYRGIFILSWRYFKFLRYNDISWNSSSPKYVFKANKHTTISQSIQLNYQLELRDIIINLSSVLNILSMLSQLAWSCRLNWKYLILLIRTSRVILESTLYVTC